MVTEVTPLSLDFAWERRFRHEGKKFRTMRQAYCYSKLCHIKRMVRRDKSLSNRKEALEKRTLPSCIDIQSTVSNYALNKMMRAMGPCKDFHDRSHEVIATILASFMSKHREQKLDILHGTKGFLLNCCRFDKQLGNGFSPAVTQWRPKAAKQGANYLGLTLMHLRNITKTGGTVTSTVCVSNSQK